MSNSRCRFSAVAACVLKCMAAVLSAWLPAVCLLWTAACSEDGPETLVFSGGPVSAEVFFPDSLPSYYDVEECTSLLLPVGRADTSNTLVLPVHLTSELPLQVPDQLQFAAGSSETVLNISVPSEQLSYNVEYPVRLYVGQVESAAGVAEYRFAVSRQYPWRAMGKAMYREDLLASLYDDVPVVEYEVEIEEHQKHPGYYRLVAPYGGCYRFHDAGRWDASEPRYLEIHAENPDKVWLPDQATGLLDADGRGMISVCSPVVEAGGSSRTSYGSLQDGCITFPVDALRVKAGDNAAWRNANHSGRFRVALPGVQLTCDYNTEFPYEPCYLCSVTSQLMSEGSRRTRTWSDQPWNVNELEELVYLPDYFGPGYGLAFHLDAAERVSDVRNPQPTGLTDSLGRMKFVQVTHGEVTHGKSFYPLKATLQLHLFSCSDDGAVAVDDSLFTEVVSASRKVNHDWGDLMGGSYYDYLNMWRTGLTSWPDGVSQSRYLTIGDCGLNQAGERVISIVNLSGLNNSRGFRDEVYAVWRDSALYVQPQMLSSTYQGDSVELRMLIPSTGQAIAKYQVMGCICEDGCLVFMSPYSDLNVSGFCFVRKHAEDRSETVLAACSGLCGLRRWNIYSSAAGNALLSAGETPRFYIFQP